MKKVLLAAFCLSVSLLSFGQNSEVQKEIKDIKFFGVDFSQVKTYGTTESIEQFRDVFGRINTLFIAEAKKFDIAKFFKKNVTATLVSQVEDLNKGVSAETLFGETEAHQLSNDMLVKEIKALPLKETEGTGLIFVAELLNKPQNQGSYHIVFFDIASRDILDSWKASGKAKGFGLRNYWAGSIFDILGNVKFK